MRFMMMYTPDAANAGPPDPKKFAAIEKDIADSKKAGAFVWNGGLHPISSGAIVKYAKGKATVTDGPYAEAKELIGGFAIFDLKSKEEAIESTKAFLKIMGGGSVEIRQMYDSQESGPCDS